MSTVGTVIIKVIASCITQLCDHNHKIPCHHWYKKNPAAMSGHYIAFLMSWSSFLSEGCNHLYWRLKAGVDILKQCIRGKCLMLGGWLSEETTSFNGVALCVRLRGESFIFFWKFPSLLRFQSRAPGIKGFPGPSPALSNHAAPQLPGDWAKEGSMFQNSK